MALPQDFSRCRLLLAGLGLLAGALWLSGCGGGSGGGGAATTPPVTSVANQGQFKGATLIKTVSATDITAAMAQGGVPASVASPRYAVNAYKLSYLTIDAQGKEVLASALVAVPQKPANALSPMISYQHGTIKLDAQAPSYLADPAAPELIMASLGYIVLSADYVGYGLSKGVSHPYLLSAPSAAAVIDMLTAAKTWRQAQGVLDNKQLFLAGYSEGAYVTMATHRALQAGNFAHAQGLVSAVLGAGPYDVSFVLDELLKIVAQQYPLLGATLKPGLLKLLSAADRNNVRDALLKEIMGSNADVTFVPTFLDNFFADDALAIDSQSNVNHWLPQVPVHLYHGRDDLTVPYLASSNTLQWMQAAGAGSRVSLTDCPAQPAGHLACVLPYWSFMLATFASDARDL